MSEGPPGCDWEAVVICSSKEAGVKLNLVKMHGTCMMDAGYCGKAGDDVTAPLGDKSIDDYKPGTTVHVWMTGNNERQPDLVASLSHPECTRTPITP
jgi:hypothetical protein